MSDIPSKKPYDHGKKAGNEGDLAKHAVLARIVDHLSKPPDSLPFIYAESHAGRAMYLLKNSKESEQEWANGIGMFFSSRALLEAWDSWRDDSIPNMLVTLKPYVENCCLEPIKAGMIYPGSSKLVSRVLWRNKVPFRFHLWDIDVEVCNDLFSNYPQWAEITVCRGDGLQGVQRLNKPSFVFIDPFSLKTDKEDILETLDKLTGIPFMCWTPLVGSQDDPVTANFRRRTESKGYAVVQVAWAKSSEHCWGCQITTSQELKSLVKETIADLLAVMSQLVVIHQWRTV